MKLKIMYSIAELARMTGETRWKIKRLITANGAKLVPTGLGRNKVVMLNQLRQAFPDFWESLDERLRYARYDDE